MICAISSRRNGAAGSYACSPAPPPKTARSIVLLRRWPGGAQLSVAFPNPRPCRLFMHTKPTLDAWVDAFIEINTLPEGADTGSDHPLWWATELTIFPLRLVDFETMWQFVMAVLARKPPRHVLGILAAGALEDMIADFGDYFIERIEDTARRDPEFRDLLHGVWKNKTPDALWERVKAARGPEPECGDGLDVRPD